MKMSRGVRWRSEAGARYPAPLVTPFEIKAFFADQNGQRIFRNGPTGGGDSLERTCLRFQFPYYSGNMQGISQVLHLRERNAVSKTLQM